MIYLAFFRENKKSATAILRTICVLFLYKTERKAGEYTEEKKRRYYYYVHFYPRQ